MTNRSLARRAAAAVAVAAAAAVLAACGGSDDKGSGGHSGHGKDATPSATASQSAGKDHNAADVSFAQGMIPHHRQAVAMADLAADRASSQQVKDLAVTIKKAQDPEIKTMSGWLTSWGEQTPAEGHGAHHSGHDMPGMMGEEDMARLEKASGKAFDTAFLELMIEHHEGAVTMAGTEQDKGSHQAAKDMAEDIVASQSAEITRMKKLLGKD
ncbi:DUF305 domain-containing protein [Streptomyces sp. XD-27]|uniref:DUF305 domain-containing protein n=1 Tax=Streptomyces sp. XD-27 TaxID=3062779 RepID=UPI0026F40E09|nr:DUF305 domain-containing protein [Streptomyces sp. XD-27]WKX74344.1 DUF305 domain-containing protein [Streptomyces sp. XD-27]